MGDAPYQPKLVKELPRRFTLTVERGEHMFHIRSDVHPGFHMAATDADLPTALAECPAALLALLDVTARVAAGEDLAKGEE